MARNHRPIFYNRRHRRLASLITTSLCLLGSLPQEGFCLVSSEIIPDLLSHSILNEVMKCDEHALLQQFNALEKILEAAQNPLEEARKFLQIFIDEVNAQYGLSFTISEACQLVRENALLPFDGSQDPLLKALILLETDPSTRACSSQEQKFLQEITMNERHWKFYWPWEWNWFGLNKKEKMPKTRTSHKSNTEFPGNIPRDEELPGNIYLGACELLAGALLLILPFGATQWAGGLLMTDGVRRIVDGAVQLSDERRETFRDIDNSYPTYNASP